GPSGRAIGGGVLRLACAPDRHADGDGDGDEATRRRDDPALGEDLRRVGVVEIPPPEDGRRIIDRNAGEFEPRRAELGLKAEAPGDVLGGAPSGEEDDEEDDGDLPPEDFGRGHAAVLSEMRLEAEASLAAEAPVDAAVAASDAGDVA